MYLGVTHSLPANPVSFIFRALFIAAITIHVQQSNNEYCHRSLTYLLLYTMHYEIRPDLFCTPMYAVCCDCCPFLFHHTDFFLKLQFLAVKWRSFDFLTRQGLLLPWLPREVCVRRKRCGKLEDLNGQCACSKPLLRLPPTLSNSLCQALVTS